MDMINSTYSLKKEQIEFYREYNFVKLKNVLDEESIGHFNKVISDQVNVLHDDNVTLAEKDTYGQAFIQKMNLWVRNEMIKELVFSQRLSRIASELMGTEGARLYHDQALYKEAEGGITPWHADQYYWPLSSDKTITAWIPLQETPLEMGPLEFSAGSQKITQGRDLMIGDESEKIMSKKLKVTDFEHVVQPFDIGEISFHSGWVFHRAGANKTDQTRKAFTIIYMDKNMKLKAPENDNQINDWKTWCPGVKIGEVINSPLNPVL